MVEEEEEEDEEEEEKSNGFNYVRHTHNQNCQAHITGCKMGYASRFKMSLIVLCSKIVLSFSIFKKK